MVAAVEMVVVTHFVKLLVRLGVVEEEVRPKRLHAREVVGC
jgi:hypothetical protein